MRMVGSKSCFVEAVIVVIMVLMAVLMGVCSGCASVETSKLDGRESQNFWCCGWESKQIESQVCRTREIGAKGLSVGKGKLYFIPTSSSSWVHYLQPQSHHNPLTTTALAWTKNTRVKNEVILSLPTPSSEIARMHSKVVDARTHA